MRRRVRTLCLDVRRWRRIRICPRQRWWTDCTNLCGVLHTIEVQLFRHVCSCRSGCTAVVRTLLGFSVLYMNHDCATGKYYKCAGNDNSECEHDSLYHSRALGFVLGRLASGVNEEEAYQGQAACWQRQSPDQWHTLRFVPRTNTQAAGKRATVSRSGALEFGRKLIDLPSAGKPWLAACRDRSPSRVAEKCSARTAPGRFVLLHAASGLQRARCEK
eukprot:SAG31_NODE_6818_length_1878_cov_1.839798_1_plen_217_part_00